MPGTINPLTSIEETNSWKPPIPDDNWPVIDLNADVEVIKQTEQRVHTLNMEVPVCAPITYSCRLSTIHLRMARARRRPMTTSSQKHMPMATSKFKTLQNKTSEADITD